MLAFTESHTDFHTELAYLRQRTAYLEQENRLLHERIERDQPFFLRGPLVFFTWRCDNGWPVEYVSPNVAALLGYQDDDFISGRVPYSTVIHPDDLARVADEVQTYSAEGRETFEQEYRLIHASGETRWIYDFTVVVRNTQGIITHYYGYILDITARKQQEDALQRYAMIVEQTPDAISTVDKTSHAIMMNTAFRRIAGLSPDEDVSHLAIADMHPEWVAHKVLDEGVPAAVRDGVWIGETALRNRTTGEEYPVSQVILAHKNAEGTVDFMSTIIRDLSAFKQAEAERVWLQQQVIDAQRAALHELSTPLIPITDTTVVMPLIGAIDSARAQQVLDSLLNGVAQHKATLAILDITGVQIVDTQVADALIRAAQAVRLLGAQVMLTGIQPQIAQTLVHLGIDLSGIMTRSTLQAGITYALKQRTTR